MSKIGKSYKKTAELPEGTKSLLEATGFVVVSSELQDYKVPATEFGDGGDFVTEAPEDGETYGRKDTVWIKLPLDTYLTDAPIDGEIYGRKDGAWSEATNPTELSIPVKNGGDFEDSVMTQTSAGDDAGINIDGQLSTGAPDNGREAVFGEGDSYPVVGAWHCTIANTTNQTVTSAVDITTEMQSDDGSTSSLFNGTAAGNYILVYSDIRTYGGTKTKVNTAGTIEPQNIIAEYLSSLNTWSSAPFMATDADSLEQRGWTPASVSGVSEQWRFGFNPLSLPVAWDELTMNINGVDYTGYFARFRITSAITSDAIIEQIKLHTNRFEINSNGATEYFGVARYPRTVNILKESNQAKTPASQNIDIAPDFVISRLANELNDNASDGIILSGVVPEGIDTSIPVQIIIDWYPNTNNAGDVELEIEVVVADDNFVYDGSATPIAAMTNITTVGASEQYQKKRSIFLLDISSSLPEERVYGSLFRDATVGNPDDTLSGTVVITDWQVLGYFWKP